MDLRSYHDTIWLPLTYKIDKACNKNKFLRKLKKAFDVHFSILGLLGILSTPESDIDCYIYAIFRHKPSKYSHLNWKQRKRMIKSLLKEIKRA